MTMFRLIVETHGGSKFFVLTTPRTFVRSTATAVAVRLIARADVVVVGILLLVPVLIDSIGAAWLHVT